MTNLLPRMKCVSIMLLAYSAALAQEPGAGPAKEKFGKLPMTFEQSQAANGVRFAARGEGYSVLLADSEAVLVLNKGGAHTAQAVKMAPARPGPCGQEVCKTDVVRMQLERANRALRVSGEEKLPGTANYFLGNDPTNWRSRVPTYGKVRYSSVYPGIDLVYYGNQRQLEYDFVVAPGADPGRIALRFGGARNIALQKNGDLLVEAKDGRIVFNKPVVYQTGATGRERRSVEGRFAVDRNHRVGFLVGTYDRSKPLVIDPVLVYSTFLGGDAGDTATGIALDSSGNAYLTGYTYAGFPVTTGSFETTDPSQTAAFISKLNSTGTALEYSTYLGGNQDTNAQSANSTSAFGIAVDAAGSAYVTGWTTSTNFPVTAGALISTNTSPVFYGVASPMAFVTKLNPTGTGLTYSTYLGPLTSHGTFAGFQGHGIAVDASGNAYVTGWASSELATTLGSFQSKDPNGQADPFVVKLNPTGTALIYGTYLTGSNNWGAGNAIAIDAEGNAYIAGVTGATDFPTKGAIQGTNLDTPAGCNQPGQPYCGTNAFISKLNSSGSALVYSTYLGGSGGAVRWADVPTAYEGNGGYTWDGASSIVLDSLGSAYVAGWAFSKNFPITAGAFQSTNYAAAQGGFSTFIAKVNPSGSALDYSTLVGGVGVLGDGDAAGGLAVDIAGNVYLTGRAHSPDFPLSPGAYQMSQNFGFAAGETAYVAKLNPIGTAISYSTYLGSTSGINPGWDVGTGIALDRNGDAFIAGFTTAKAFPVTTGAFQTNIANTNPGNAFVSEFDLGPENGTYYHSATSVTVSSPQAVGQNVTFTAKVVSSEGRGMPTGSVVFAPTNQGYQAYGTAGLNGAGEATYTTKYANPGKYTVYATYSGDSGFTANSTGAATVTILGGPAAVSVVSGSGQSVVYGNPFPEPLVAIVKDTAGDPLPGQTVTFAGRNLSFSSVTVTTGANGEASVTATPTQAGSLTASATVSGVSAPANFTLTATTAPGLSVSSGNGQTGVYGSTLAQPLTVLVTAPTGAALPNVTVNFSGAGLRLSSAAAVTNAQGLATVTATVTAVGSLTATASVTGKTNTVSFNETGTKALLKVTANNATVVWGEPLPPLTYSITGFVNGDTSSVVSGAPVETSTEGSAPGSYPITITQGTLAAADYSFTFVDGTLTAVASNVPAAISIYSGNGQQAFVGTAFAQLLEVRVINQFGDPVVGVPVSFVGAGLVVSSSIAYTNANGVAAVGAAAVTEGIEACAAEAASSIRVMFNEVGVKR